MKANKESITLESLSPILIGMLKENIDVILTISGNSMFPMLISKRDSVVLTNCDKQNLKKGDLPLYVRANGKYVLHRIVGVNKESYNMCGDNQYTIEMNLPKENIIALVKAFERKGKFIECNNIFYRLYYKGIIFSIPLRRVLFLLWRKLRGKK